MRVLIIHQTYPDAERDLRRNACTAVAPTGMELEFAEIGGGRMLRGDSLSPELFAAEAAPPIIKLAQQAQERGVDAVVPLGVLDLGFDAAPSHVSIPVVGAGRTGLHIAATVSARIGVIVYGKSAARLTWRIARECGVAPLVTSIRPVHMTNREMSERPEDLLERIVANARHQIDEEGAEVIVPHGISMVPVNAVAADLAGKLGVPVIDGLAASLRVAELLASSGYRRARDGNPS